MTAPSSPKPTRPIQLEKGWLDVMRPEFEQPYMVQLRAFLVDEMRRNKVFPPGKEIFSAFNTTPFQSVRVVILGQDPYHGPGQAHGLCFSVRHGVKTPPSLQNIYRELNDDLGIPPADHGNLMRWAEQGVLLLNTVLTVRSRQAFSHRGKGWETFTDRVIEQLNARREGLVFVLWGSAAGRKASMIDSRRHGIVRSPHPSPLSAHRGFFGSRPFSKINAMLEQRGTEPIDWRVGD